jgi:hypothetical protein
LGVSEHFTLRFRAGTTQRLERRARLTGTAPRSLATRDIEEGIRHDHPPLIHFLDGETGRRAAVLGTNLDVWELIATVRDHDSDLPAAAEHVGVPVGVAEAAVTYYGEFRDEIDEEIAVNEAESERGEAAWRKGHQALGR